MIEGLMIGDWVFCTYPSINTPVKVAEIKTVGDNELKTVVYHDDIRLVFCEKYIDPIPLTAEILEKNGFKKSIFRDIEGQHQWSWWRDTLTVVTLWMRELNDNPTDGWMIRIESTLAACCLKISSVHELQHTLKLCGISKEIVL